ncbi:60S ribosome subunit biogenesis protein NIP7 [Physcia stellaris]|nr:60S ribosome subunit biogenesis protein NIP7 [Physcia stellaris]
MVPYEEGLFFRTPTMCVCAAVQPVEVAGSSDVRLLAAEDLFEGNGLPEEDWYERSAMSEEGLSGCSAMFWPPVDCCDLQNEWTVGLSNENGFLCPRPRG